MANLRKKIWLLWRRDEKQFANHTKASWLQCSHYRKPNRAAGEVAVYKTEVRACFVHMSEDQAVNFYHASTELFRSIALSTVW